MRVHVVGAGPTGISIAWELLSFTDHEVILYDRKSSAGGSWWEPSVHTRDLHAHRAVFEGAFVNTRSLMSEMHMKWDDLFFREKSSVYGTFFKSFGPKDYWALTSLFVKVFISPDTYRWKSIRESIGPMTPQGQRLMETLPYVMDGVSWDVMTAYEFVQNINHVTMSTPQTQRVSGKVMCDDMQEALEAKGARLRFGKTLEDVEYRNDGFTATFSDGEQISDGLLVMCVDHNAAPGLIKDNWGPVHEKITGSAYDCINVLVDYDEPIELGDTLALSMKTRWTILPEVLHDGKTVSCVLCKLTDEILSTPPEELKRNVMEQVGLPKPRGVRIAWGAEWDGKRWHFKQSSGVLSTQGQIPFYGKSNSVALCGMMSHRHTPYASIEAAVEVGRRFCHGTFGTREPLTPLLLTDVLMLLIVFLLLLFI